MIKNSFYEFANNTAYNPQFTHASAWHPKSPLIDQVCRECGVRKYYPSGAFDVSVEGGSEYPDILLCGAYPFLIVSQALIDDWMAAGIHSFHTFPVNVVQADAAALRTMPAPAYYRVEIDGRCQIDLEASGLRVIKHCPLCGHIVTEPSLSSGFKMVNNSWDGSPLFRDPDLYPCVTFCTERILELARKHKRTNFRFEFMQGPRDIFSAGIEYLEE